MTDPNLYQLAKQGDPDAIATLLNEILKLQGITISAKRLEECLLLAITCEQIADRETLVDTVRQQLIELESKSITKVRMVARQKGQKDSAWQVEFDLEYPKPLPSLDFSLAMNDDEDEAKDGLHAIGDVIRDRYRVLEVLGQGGNGITYAATDLQQNKKVAVKALSLRHMNDWKQIELFEREAKVLSQLDHVAIPKYFDFFTIDTVEDRAFYIVQELAQGQNLAKLIEAGWRTNEMGVKKIAEQVLNILIYLHGLNPPVIHRDIKPHNLIYGDDGKVSLVDFGAVQDTYRSTMARGSTVIGTFGYMAPEQFRGQAVSATDLFSLGATVLFILTHRSPSELPQERLRYDFRSKIKVSQQFADWLQKMVEPEIETRFTSASESLAALQKKQIVWFPRKRLSWQAWIAIAGIGSILTAFTITNKWMIMEFYNLYPKICLSQGNESSITTEDIQELVEYAKQSKNLSNKFPSQATERDRCLTSNFNGEILDILSQRGIQLDYDELLHSAKVDMFLDWFISKKIDINTKYKDNKTALSIVVYNYLYLNNDIDIFKILKTLIKSGADINNRDNLGQTPLHYAAFIDDIQVVIFLLKNGADINAKDNNEVSPLGYSVIMQRSLVHENIGVFTTLIENGANINIRDKKGITPLHYAVAGTPPNCLIEDRVDNCIHKSGIGNMSKNRVDILIKKGAYINAKDKNGNTPLDYAFKASYKRESGYYGIINNNNNKSSIIHLLIKNGADINNIKIINNQNDFLSNKDNQEIIESPEIINFLIKKGVNININAKNKSGATALHYASSMGGLDTIKLLFERNANINAKDNNGDTPIHYATKAGQIESFKILIEKGVDVNTKDNNGITPLHDAIRAGQIESFKILIEKGVDVNTKDNNGTTPLHDAIRAGQIESFKILIEKGVDVNTKDNNGITPLHDAIRAGQIESFKILIEKGADVNAKDSNGNTPLVQALAANKLGFAEELIVQDADFNINSIAGLDLCRLLINKYADYKTCLNLKMDKKAYQVIPEEDYQEISMAIFNGDLNKIKALIKAEKNINGRNRNGDTILHYASYNGNLEIVKLLIDNGADINAVNNNVKTPLSIAGSKEVKEFLIQKGAK